MTEQHTSTPNSFWRWAKSRWGIMTGIATGIAAILSVVAYWQDIDGPVPATVQYVDREIAENYNFDQQTRILVLQNALYNIDYRLNSIKQQPPSSERDQLIFELERQRNDINRQLIALGAPGYAVR